MSLSLLANHSYLNHCAFDFWMRSKRDLCFAEAENRSPLGFILALPASLYFRLNLF